LWDIFDFFKAGVSVTNELMLKMYQNKEKRPVDSDVELSHAKCEYSFAVTKSSFIQK
jgi:hypothetical protein